MNYDAERGVLLAELVSETVEGAQLRKMFGHETWFLNTDHEGLLADHRSGCKGPRNCDPLDRKIRVTPQEPDAEGKEEKDKEEVSDDEVLLFIAATSARSARATWRQYFEVWDNYISGRTLELEENRRIVQSWRTTEFDDREPDSRLEIVLEADDKATILTLRHSEIPDGQGDDSRQRCQNQTRRSRRRR